MVREHRLVSPRRAFAAALSVTIAGASGCAHWHDTRTIESAMLQHDYATVESRLDHELGTPNGGLPDDHQRQTTIRVFDRAMMRMARRDFEGAARDLTFVDKTIDVDEMERVSRSRNVGNPGHMTELYEQGWMQALNFPFGAKVYERLLVNPLAAMAYLEMDRRRDACVEARRFGVVADFARRIAKGRALNAHRFGELVSAIACDGVDAPLACESLERSGDLGASFEASELSSSCRAESSSHGKERVDIWIVVAYGSAGRPKNERKEAASGLYDWVSTPEQSADSKPRSIVVAVDSERMTPSPTLDVAELMREDFAASQKGYVVRADGRRIPLRRTWSPDAFEHLVAQMHLAHLAVRPGPRRIRVEVGGVSLERTVNIARRRSRLVTFFRPDAGPLEPCTMPNLQRSLPSCQREAAAYREEQRRIRPRRRSND